MGKNECRSTALGYILEALLGLCFNSMASDILNMYDFQRYTITSLMNENKCY